ncbi:MAG: tRNA (adenosine(37)-N6)-threonylcarbamoyltransferase complex transferase subunit TsaD [Phycisphaerales bacterium JB043]
MLILAIETSCDETSSSIVRDGVEVLSNIIHSQDELHVEYGGVVPEIASRAHTERMIPVLEESLTRAGCAWSDIDAIAVANRPGLIGSLLVGVTSAKGLACALGLPLIGVDHIEAHLYAGCLESTPPPFPALGLVVSGGHTSLFACTNTTTMEQIGSTIDDAVGEAYDKAAVLLGLDYPGGPRLDAMAREGDDSTHEFPVSMLDRGSLDFSFSGLKTSVLYTVRGTPERVDGKTVFPRDGSELSEREKRDIAAGFQKAAVDALMSRMKRAIEQAEYKSILVGGGVSANSLLRERLSEFAERHGLELRLPGLRYCLDNAAMIAGYAFHLFQAGRVDDLALSAMPTSARR